MNQSQEIQARDSHLTGRPVTTSVALKTLSRPLQVEDAVNQSLEIQVRDSHLTGRALLGHVSFPLTRLPPDGALDAWLPVLDAQPITANAKPVGDIHLQLTYKVWRRPLICFPSSLIMGASLPIVDSYGLAADAKPAGESYLKLMHRRRTRSQAHAQAKFVSFMHDTSCRTCSV